MRSRTGRMALAGFLGAGVLVATIAPAAAQAPLSVTVCHTQDIGLIDPARGVLLNELNNLWVNMYETLVSREPGGRLVPAVAESWEVKSPTEWVFKIRRGITFHDGEPLNAEAVKATLDRYQEKDKPRYGAVAAGVKDVTVIDPYTVRITTPTPGRRLPRTALRGAHPAARLPQAGRRAGLPSEASRQRAVPVGGVGEGQPLHPGGEPQVLAG